VEVLEDLEAMAVLEWMAALKLMPDSIYMKLLLTDLVEAAQVVVLLATHPVRP
jgi:hypothetical protein